jgi:hypothetical protein
MGTPLRRRAQPRRSGEEGLRAYEPLKGRTQSAHGAGLHGFMVIRSAPIC